MPKYKPYTTRYSTSDRRFRNLDKNRKEKKERKKATVQEKFTAFVNRIPQVISGEKKATTTAERRIYNSFWSAVTLSIFEDVYQGYLDKAEGGPDELGHAWPDLAVSTKAYKRPRRGLLSSSQRRRANQSTIGLLSPSQYAKWKETFAKVYNREYRNNNINSAREDTDAKAKAAKIAWAQAKTAGAETYKAVLGEKDMQIMRVTDTLLKSFHPGKISNRKYIKGNKHQVVKLDKGDLEIGTNVAYAKMASSRKTGQYKISREILPKNLGVWYERAIGKGRDAIAVELKKLSQEKKLFK